MECGGTDHAFLEGAIPRGSCLVDACIRLFSKPKVWMSGEHGEDVATLTSVEIGPFSDDQPAY